MSFGIFFFRLSMQMRKLLRAECKRLLWTRYEMKIGGVVGLPRNPGSKVCGSGESLEVSFSPMPGSWLVIPKHCGLPGNFLRIFQTNHEYGLEHFSKPTDPQSARKISNCQEIKGNKTLVENNGSRLHLQWSSTKLAQASPRAPDSP